MNNPRMHTNIGTCVWLLAVFIEFCGGRLLARPHPVVPDAVILSPSAKIVLLIAPWLGAIVLIYGMYAYAKAKGYSGSVGLLWGLSVNVVGGLMVGGARVLPFFQLLAFGLLMLLPTRRPNDSHH